MWILKLIKKAADNINRDLTDADFTLHEIQF